MDVLSHFHTAEVPMMKDVPIYQKKDISPWAGVEYFEYDKNSVLIQSFLNKYYSLFIYNFRIVEEAAFDLIFENPTASLQFMLKGNISYAMDSHRYSDIKSKHCRLFYFPSGAYKVCFRQGEYEVIQYNISSECLQALSDRYTLLKPFLFYTKHASKTSRAMKECTMGSLLYNLQKMRRYKDTGWDLRFRMETMMGYLVEKYIESLSRQKHNA